MKICHIAIAFLSFINLASAKGFEVDYALSLGSYYGYTDYSAPKPTPYKANTLNATINAYIPNANATITNATLSNTAATIKNAAKKANPTKIGQRIILSNTIANIIVANIIEKIISKVIIISPFSMF